MSARAHFTKTTPIKRKTKFAAVAAFITAVIAGAANLLIRALLIALLVWQIVDAIRHPGFWNYFDVALVGIITVGAIRHPVLTLSVN